MPQTARPKRHGQHLVASRPSSGRELLKNKAYDELKSRILQNQYPPGSFLAERQLADELGMSKTPVKAALERLEYEGFIAVSPQQGIVVRELSINEIRDFYEIRAALEGYVLRALAGNLTTDQLQLWQANLREQELNCRKGDQARAVVLDTEFHLLPCLFMANHEISRTMQQLADKMQVVIHRVFTSTPSRAADSLSEHREIVAAVRRGDGRKAGELIEDHLMRGQQLLTAPRDARNRG